VPCQPRCASTCRSAENTCGGVMVNSSTKLKVCMRLYDTLLKLKGMLSVNLV
jgi:hypothetical protein